MAFPTRRRGLRSITMNNTLFRWRFSPSRPNEISSTLVVYDSIPAHQMLKLTLHGWIDPWAVFPFATNNQPRIISSAFVRSAIEFTLAKGWQPDQKGAPFVVQWKDESFTIDEAMKQNEEAVV